MIAEAIVTMGMVVLSSKILPGIHAADTQAAVLAGLILSGIYLLLRPLAKLLAKPISCLTFGLFGTVVDAWMVMLCSYFMKEKFVVDSFWWALLLALGVNLIRGMVAGGRESRRRK